MHNAICIARLGFAIATTTATLIASTSAQEKSSPERIVFLGDSITEAGNQPGGYVCLIRDAVQSANDNEKIEVIGAGVSGNKVPDLEARLDRDVLAHKPTTVVIYIGINDVWHSLQGKGTPPEDYRSGLRNLIDRIRASGARVVLCTPSVIGERAAGTNELDQQLDAYAKISREVADETKAPLIDLRAAFVEQLKTANPQDAANGILTSDGVHLNQAGNRFVAEVILRGLGHPVAQGSLRHVVLVKFKPDLDPKLLEETVQQLRALKDKIDVVQSLESGTDVSKEDRAQGFTHCFILTFADEQARDHYLQHEAHKAFVSLAIPRVENVLVFDFWAK